jgi:hypothetical protein
MPSVLAQAIARQEGFSVSGSIAQRDNNPGNLMSPPGGTWAGQVGVDSSGFAIFDNATDGWNALDTDISSNAGLTLSQFISKYAPSSENDTQTASCQKNSQILVADSAGEPSCVTPPKADNGKDNGKR